ncbi:hypothetical protein PybrP1_012228 [[Pythium] brassicae (nom. inval.)]|nr:hypothetical protein PybrP1_012228 [[Pythium] brassicae (nom. inval.)]
MRPSRRIQDAQQALLAQDALRYAPSLSPQVMDALFSFWRLPLAVRREAAVALPEIALDAMIGSAVVDWGRLAVCLGASTGDGGLTTPTETAWAFALQAEAAVAATLLGAATDSAVRVVAATTHGEYFGQLLELLRADSGEFYMAFVVLITVLERALYDLYYDQGGDDDSGGADSDSESARISTKTTMTTAAKKKNMILRDLLHSAPIARALPEGLLRLLHVLFLPSGLNLRNLVWHGFVVPAEFPRCFGCLLAVLVLALPRRAHEQPAEPLFDVRSYDRRFFLHDDALRRQLDALFQCPATADGTAPGLTALLDASGATSSSFVPMGRRQLVAKAFRALAERGDELWFLFALLPVLEHAVRVAFVATNRDVWGVSSAYGAAQIDAYYSTLDGFGQRDKHQVLLHPRVVRERAATDSASRGGDSDRVRRNQLYTVLPAAALAACLDLFMMAAGPNLRAKLCHGEADLATLLQRRPPGTGIAVATQLVVLAWFSMCRAMNASSSRKDDGPPCSSQSLVSAGVGPADALVDAFEERYVSSFHPFYQLERALGSALAAATEFAVLRCRSTHFQLARVDAGASEPMVYVEFASAGEPFGILEKQSRLSDFHALLQRDGLFAWRDSGDSATPCLPAPAQASPPKGSFPDLLGRLHAKLSDVLAALERHNAAHHGGERLGAFLALLRADAAPASRVARLGADSESSAALLALSDDDGPSVAACMLEIVASAQRAASSFQSRHVELEQLVATGRARTNHRRSFLNSVFFLPVFEAVQAACLSLVEHQLAHRRMLALCADNNNSSRSSCSECAPLCPQARSVGLLQRKLLLFVTAFEGCAGGGGSGAASAAQKSAEKALLLALQFFDSKVLASALGPL